MFVLNFKYWYFIVNLNWFGPNILPLHLHPLYPLKNIIATIEFRIQLFVKIEAVFSLALTAKRIPLLRTASQSKKWANPGLFCLFSPFFISISIIGTNWKRLDAVHGIWTCSRMMLDADDTPELHRAMVASQSKCIQNYISN